MLRAQPPLRPDVHVPRAVPALGGIPIKAIGCAWSYCNALSEAGDVWQWGYNRRGDFYSQLKPRKVAGIQQVPPQSPCEQPTCPTCPLTLH